MPVSIWKRAAGIVLSVGIAAAAPTHANADVVNGSQKAVSAANTVELDGKPVDPEVAQALEDWASSQNMDLKQEFRETPVTYAGQAKDRENGIALRHRGGIEPPAGYVYDPARGSLHDYCTKSPDQFPAPGENADFSGACARHDMCYEKNADPAARVRCNVQLNRDMVTICKAVYTSSIDPRRSGCISTAGVYFAAVTAAHPSQWVPTIS